MGRFAIDVTACWRPRRVGMLTVAVELSKALVEHKGKDDITLLCSRERPAALAGLECEAVLSPYRHELVVKTRWLPGIGLGLTLWEGVFENLHWQWLRWCDQAGRVLPTGPERIQQERQRADDEKQRAERLAEKLRSLGIDPTTLEAQP